MSQNHHHEAVAYTEDWLADDRRGLVVNQRTHGIRSVTHALLAIHDLLDARLPATTPQDPVGASVAGAGRESGSVGGGDENGAEIDAEPPVGTWVTDSVGDVFFRDINGSWRFWDTGRGKFGPPTWSWSLMQGVGPFAPTTDADRERTGAPKPTTPLPEVKDDEVIVKRDLVERVVEVLDGEGYRVRASQLRAALDRGQGA